MKKNILIVGGTSGVGKELAKHYVADGHNVCITGRHDPGLRGAVYQDLEMTDDPVLLAAGIDRVLDGFQNIDTMIYAAGFLQRGRLDTLEDADLGAMVNVGILSPMLLARRLKKRCAAPVKLMLITSSSQYIPRELEPAYCATKSAMGMLGASLARDPEIGKVLVVAPSGIRTRFWDGTDEDTRTMLDPEWTSDQIVALSGGPFKYRFAKILRNPPRVEVVETLDATLRPAGVA